MSKRQQVVVAVGLAVGILCVLFPPRIRTANGRKLYGIPASRGFLFSPRLNFEQQYDPVTNMGTGSREYELDLARLTLECILIGMGTALGAIICQRLRVKRTE
jgi:hypothetical protein